MFVEVCPRSVFVFLPGSPKKCMENRGFRMCTHIKSWLVVVEVRVGVRPPPRYKSDIDNRPDERRQGAVESPTYTYCDRRWECPLSRWRFGQKKKPMLQDEYLRTRFKVICNSFASSRPGMRACELCLASCPSYIRRPLIAPSKLSESLLPRMGRFSPIYDETAQSQGTFETSYFLWEVRVHEYSTSRCRPLWVT
jgi:hypothetical protein